MIITTFAVYRSKTHQQLPRGFTMKKLQLTILIALILTLCLTSLPSFAGNYYHKNGNYTNNFKTGNQCYTSGQYTNCTNGSTFYTDERGRTYNQQTGTSYTPDNRGNTIGSDGTNCSKTGRNSTYCY